MKHITLLGATALLLVSCSSTNRIFSNQDDFKDRTTLALKQPMKGYSDEMARGLYAPYTVTFSHFYSESEQGSKDYILDIQMKTQVRAYELEPALYISMDGKKVKLEPEEQITRVFESGSTSSSSETNTTTRDDPENPDEEISETITTYTTSSSHDTYQLMHLRLQPDLALMKELRMASDVKFKIYIANEGIEIPFRWKNRYKYNRYIDRITG